MLKKGDLGLRARGIVLTGSGLPVVLVAIDWIGIANGAQDEFKQALAEAAGTSPERVAVHTLHQHDAPICDFTSEQILIDAGIDPGCFDGTYARELISDLQSVIKSSMKEAKNVTHISLGEAPVYGVASNRRILNEEGKVRAGRSSSCRDPELTALSEGVIDPMVSVIGFWDGDTPVAVMSLYATHPQSYYLTKIANPDFPGVARFYRQMELPGPLHIHFNGAGGNVAAGKYNDGSPEMRHVLAQRMANGMRRAWESSNKIEISPDGLDWKIASVALPAADNIIEIEKRMKNPDLAFNYLPNNMGKLAWYKRRMEGKKIGLGCLTLGEARVLFMPGELFVEYQLAAKKMRPDLFVAMAAYGDYGPFYIGTKEAYSQGGYEINSSPVTSEVESELMRGMKELLQIKE
ncbi:MAG: hypothetical protein PHH93_06720 [Prolixibacteraceae bacterium]|nr:hypothetical protein [Prolixibacteraceae bacterium]